MPHVDDGTLHALLDGALRAEEPVRADEVEAHLETCADCRARLEQAGKLRGLASDVLASLDAEADLTVSLDFRDVVARAAGHAGAAGTAPGSLSERGQRQYRWTRGLAWAATIVVALGTGYFVRDLAGPLAQRSGQELLPRQVPGPTAGTDATESEALGRGDAAPQTEAASAAEQAEDALSQQPAQAARTVAAPAEPDANIDAEAPKPLESRTADAAEETGPGAAAFKLADVIPAPHAWVEAEVTDLESRVGTILVLPGAEIARAELLPGIDTVARTLQVLPDGVEVHVIQSIAASAQRREGEPAAALAAPAPAGVAEADRNAPTVAADAPARLLATRARSMPGPDSGSRDAETVHVVHAASLGRAGVALTLIGPLPADVLERLAVTALPRQR